MSRKYEFKKKRGEKPATYSANIERQVVKIQRLYQTLTDIRVDYENKIIAAIDRYYPSSKKCSQCGRIKADLKLKDRIYRCECDMELDRDLNAAINLKNATEYEIA